MSRYNRHIHARPGEHITVHRHDGGGGYGSGASDDFLPEVILWVVGGCLLVVLFVHFWWIFLILGLGPLFSSK